MRSCEKINVIRYDNHDGRICYYEWLLERKIFGLPKYSLPDGYRFASDSDGHRERWIEIEISAKEFAATSFYDIYGRDASGAGWLHWVAVKREYQGKGLSKPLITCVLNVMMKLGYSHAKIPPQTNTGLACKVYLDLGFLPLKENLEHSYEGWKIVKELTSHSVLKDIMPNKIWFARGDNLCMEYRENVLCYEDYSRLRESVGWLNFSKSQAEKAL